MWTVQARRSGLPTGEHAITVDRMREEGVSDATIRQYVSSEFRAGGRDWRIYQTAVKSAAVGAINGLVRAAEVAGFKGNADAGSKMVV